MDNGRFSAAFNYIAAWPIESMIFKQPRKVNLAESCVAMGSDLWGSAWQKE